MLLNIAICRIKRKYVLQMTKRNTSYIGFIGLGNMGNKMAQNLIKKNESLIIYDTNLRSIQLFQNKKNVEIAENVIEVAQKSDCIITMLPNNDAVWSVYTKNDGILKNFGKKGFFIDCSSIDPSIPQKISKLSEGNIFLDAPVSGGVIGAENGTLTFMVGGCELTTNAIKPLLLKMGTRVVYCGSSGMGQTAKLCNNMLLAVTMAALAESMDLGVKFGLDPKVLSSIINSSSGRCWSSEVNNPVPGVLENVPSSRNYEGGFKTNLMLKDVNLALNLAKQMNLSTPLTIKAREIYEKMTKRGYSEKDFSAVYKCISEK